MEQQQLEPHNSNPENALQNATANEEIRMRLQNFVSKLNSAPTQESIGKTPDGRALTVTISHIEMTLDELFFGLWSTENYKWSVISNEVVGSIDLLVFHPTAGLWLRRSGAASIQIMVNAMPDDVKNNPQAKSSWALDVGNKKSNALDMGFPKLKAECIKNAAQSLGGLFGRDLNRQNKDKYVPVIKNKWSEPVKTN